jgi:Kip1 ubiquitination-promoting complex protein 1
VIVYGDSCVTGDVIGCAIDTRLKTIQYWRNGSDLGIAYSNIPVDSDTPLCPLIAVGKRARLLCNFGKFKFAFPQGGYMKLHLPPPPPIPPIIAMFEKYKGSGTDLEIFVINI